MYWLDQKFDDQYYDLSALVTIKFNNIGGCTNYIDFSDKAELALQSIDYGNLEYIQQSFYLSGFTGGILRSVTANNLYFVGEYLEMYGNGFIDGPNIVFPKLETIGINLYLDYNSNYNGMSNTACPAFPALKNIGDSFYIYQNNFKSYPVFTSLTNINNSLNFYNNSGDGGASYSGPGFPALTKVNSNLSMYNNWNMTDVPEFTNLLTVKYWVQFFNCNALTTFPSFPVLTNIYYAGIESYDCPAMTSVGAFLPSIKQINGDVNFQNCALDEVSIDLILTRLASLDGTNGTTNYEYKNIYLNGGTNSIPSATGLAAKSVLESRGCNVYVNS